MRFFYVCLLVLLAIPAAVLASEQRFIYGDTTNWYTYDASGRVGYGYPSVPTAYYYADRDSIVFKSNDDQGSHYYYAPARSGHWSCVGSGCGKTPYVRPILHDDYAPRIYNYNTPAVWQPW